MALSSGFNPFANADLRVPVHLKDSIRQHSRAQRGTDSDAAPHASVPFNRMVDAWLLAAAIGAATGQKVKVGDQGIDTEKFVTGAVLQNNPRAIEFLMNLAVADSEDPYIVTDPNRMIKIADQYAAGGMDQMFELLNKGHQDAVTNLMRGLSRTFKPKDSPRPTSE